LTGRWRRFHNEDLEWNQIKEDGYVTVIRKARDAHTILVGKLERKDEVEEENIGSRIISKIVLKEIRAWLAVQFSGSFYCILL
jgi:hypothetical protein